MFIRGVKIACIPGMEEELRKIGRDKRETLLAMKKSAKYQRLLEALKPLEADGSDHIFTADTAR